MSSLSALVTRVQAEILDATNATFSANIAGTNYSELQQYVVDGMNDWGLYNYQKIYDTTLSSTANSWFIPISGLASIPRDTEFIQNVWFWPSPSSRIEIEDFEILSNSTLGVVLGFGAGNSYSPLWVTQDNRPVHLNYYGPWPIPSAGSASIANPSWQENAFVDFGCYKALNKMSVDQRGINKDLGNEFRSKAEYRHKNYLEQRKKWTTTLQGAKF